MAGVVAPLDARGGVRSRTILRVMPGRQGQERLLSVVFLIPAVLVLLATSVYPLGYSLVLSFHTWNMSIPNSRAVFKGLDNYAALLRNGEFASSVQVTLVFVAVAVAIEFVVGLAVAVLVTSPRLRGVGAVRTALLIPVMMTPVVAGVLWRSLFHSTYGIINFALGWIGIPPQEWLGSADQALASVITVEIWQQLPVVIFVVAAGIQSLPGEVFDAAKVDGATALQSFRYVMLPLLKPVLVVVLLLRVMDAFKIFDIIYTLTQGGPGGSTQVLSMLIYKTGLKFFQIGQASAMSWVFLVFILLISLLFIRQLERREGA
jgi:multiple sugar transport system permease protein